MEPVEPMDVVKQNEIMREVLRMTNSDQQRRILKDCFVIYRGGRALKELLLFRLDCFNDNKKELNRLMRDPEKEEKILALADAQQQRKMLEDCLLGLTSPELKKLLYRHVKEFTEFNRLIREVGGRTVVPYEVDQVRVPNGAGKNRRLFYLIKKVLNLP